MTPVMFRARATELLVDLQGTEAGRLVSACWSWVRRQLLAERSTSCSYPGCTGPARWQPVDAGAGGLCDEHEDLQL